jgi:quercetin dioxygenase-like cupin family protein
MPRKIMQPDTKPKSKALGAEVAKAADLVSYQDGSIMSREIVKKPTGSVTVFAFDEGQGLSEHTTPFDALVQVLEGEVEITIAGKTHRLQGGELILMPAQQPHDCKTGTTARHQGEAGRRRRLGWELVDSSGRQSD